MTEFLGRISNDPTWLKDVLLRVINNSQALNEQIVAKSKRLLESPS